MVKEILRFGVLKLKKVYFTATKVLFLKKM